jgi:hypothetical protein
MGALDNLFQCSLGGSSFQLENYSYQETPIIVTNVGRTGSTISIKGTGWLQDADVATFSSDLIALPTGFRASGLAFNIYGIGGVLECQVTPQMCVEGGPHFALTVENQSEALIKPISFEVTAKTFATFSSITQTGYQESVTTKPDGNRVVQRDGVIVGGNITVAEALAAFQQIYPPANWVISYKSSANNLGQNVSYSFTAVELDQTYPLIGGGGGEGGTAIVDGECNSRTDRDEQYRVATVYDYDLLVVGDYTAVVTAIRADAVASEKTANLGEDETDSGEEAVVVRESVSVTTYKETRIKASFEFIRGGDGNQLLNWTQTIDLVDDDDAYTLQQYNGADAVLIKQSNTLPRVVQQGTATGLGVFPEAPDPIIEDAYLERPRITLVAVNQIECQTNWNYVLAATDDFDLNDYTGNLVRPSKPTFYDSGT